MPALPSAELAVLDNPQPLRHYEIRCETPELTCLCPRTGQPDFADVEIVYVPAEKIVELKSLKLYLWSYRDEGAFHEAVTNRILDDLVAALEPRFLRLTARWYVRGGIFTTVEAEHRRPGWTPAPRVELGSFAPGASTRP